MAWLIWLYIIALLANAANLFLQVYFAVMYSDLEADYINPIDLCNKLNIVSCCLNLYWIDRWRICELMLRMFWCHCHQSWRLFNLGSEFIAAVAFADLVSSLAEGLTYY
jgi:hypothetical protein